MVDVQKWGGRWFVASDAGVFEIMDTGGEDPWLQKVETRKPLPGEVSPDLATSLNKWAGV